MISVRVSFVLALASQGFAQKDVTDLFNVDVATNLEGGCGYVGRDRLNNLLQDSLTLANAGLGALADYGDPTRPEARRLIDVYFKGTTTARRDAVKDKYKAVKDWITQGGSVNNGRFNGHPWLFCYHNWAQKLSMDSDAYDARGQRYTDLYGNIVHIRDVQIYRDRQAAAAAELGISVAKVFPYWSLKHGVYFFEQAHASGPNTGYCSDNNNRGLMSDELSPPFVMLCPVSFGTDNTRPRNWNYRNLRWAVPNPITKNQVQTVQIPQGAQVVTEVTPTAATMFHELFHLVLGPESGVTAPPNGREVYDLDEILVLSFDEAVSNPESYMLAAVAYDYTRNINPVNGDRIEFEMGYTTRG